MRPTRPGGSLAWLTVEEGRGVDAAAVHGAQYVPHLLEGAALGESDDETDSEKHGVEDDGADAKLAKGSEGG